MLGTIYLTKCMLLKCLKRKRGLPIVLFGLFIAALGILIVASVARNRELQSPWYMQRSATVLFEYPVSPKELYSSLHDAFREGSVNGYALIADIDVSGGISLGGLEGNLWNPVDSEDDRFSTRDNIFWIHQQAVPEAYFYDLDDLRATINGIELDCAGLTYYGLNWDWSQNTHSTDSIAFTLDGKRPVIGYPVFESVNIGGDWIYIAPVLTGSTWMAENDIPIIGACITLSQPNDLTVLKDIVDMLSTPCTLTTEWNAGRIGSLTANEWVYLGALVLALLNIAALFYGLIDSYKEELFIFRKIGATKRSICIASSILVILFSCLASLLARGVFEVLFHCQGDTVWLASLPGSYNCALFLAFIGICALLSLNHLNGILKNFRRIGTNL